MNILLYSAYAFIIVIAVLLLFWLIKKKQYKLILIAVPILLVVAFACTYIPHNVFHINPSSVSKIAIFDGNSGEDFDITDKTDIQLIINNLNEVTFQKGKPSLGYMGYRFNAKFFDQEGDLIKELIINSDDTIRYKGFFYKTTDDILAYHHIDELLQELER